MKPRVALGVAVLCALIASCGRRSIDVSLPPVPTTLLLREAASSTTLGPDYSETPLDVPLASNVPTTTIGFDEGRAGISGVVTGPEGPLEGATVRIERFVGSDLAVKDVLTDKDGRYVITNIRTGRIRIRAWKAPHHAALESLTTFAGGASYKQDLEVKRYDQTSIQWSLAPSSPIVNEPANISVQVTQQDIGVTDGVLRPRAVNNVGVRVSPLGFMQPDVLTEVPTNDRGRVSVALRCVGVGSSDLQVSLATGESAVFSPPGCQPRPTAPPVSVVDPSASVLPAINSTSIAEATSVPGPVGVPIPVRTTAPGSPVTAPDPTLAIPPVGPSPIAPAPAPPVSPPVPVAPPVVQPEPPALGPVPAVGAPPPAAPPPGPAPVPTVSVVPVPPPAP